MTLSTQITAAPALRAGGLLLFAVAACAPLPDRGIGAYMVLEGQIVPGAECPLLRTDNGEFFALSTEGADLGLRERVRVSGRRAEMSFCQEGQYTISVDRIDRLPG